MTAATKRFRLISKVGLSVHRNAPRPGLFCTNITKTVRTDSIEYSYPGREELDRSLFPGSEWRACLKSARILAHARTESETFPR